MDGTKLDRNHSALLADVWRRLTGARRGRSGAREISVLFADMRGFTAFSESREPAEIFSTVNRYTEKISKVVHQHGGRVVQFNGDGIMAVFGAPRVLPAKERAAVEAGHAILAAIGSPTWDASGGTVLSLGIGVATGTDYVGDVELGDRVVWTAIGNTSNLASRLQGLSRDLDAAIVIDRRTCDASGKAAAGFQCHRNVPIRGRRNREDVFILPLASLDWRPQVDQRSLADTLNEARQPGFAQALA